MKKALIIVVLTTVTLFAYYLIKTITIKQEMDALLTVADYAYFCGRAEIPFERVTNNVVLCYPWGRLKNR